MIKAKDYTLKVDRGDGRGFVNVQGVTSFGLNRSGQQVTRARRILKRCTRFNAATVYNAAKLYGYKLPHLNNAECHMLTAETIYSYQVIREAFPPSNRA